MKRDRRSEILDISKQLFNERGFNAVSIRDIANHLGISSGNLTYYFNKKEEIMEALIDENSDESWTKPIEKLDELDAFFIHIQQVVQDNAFYFWHHAQLSQLSSKIRKKQEDRYDYNVKILKECLNKLKSERLIRAEKFIHEYDRVIDTLLISSIYWIPFSNIKGLNYTQESYRNHAWSIMYNLLTDKGRNELSKIIDN
ncbi:TetR/AcrR family transcriptional regulator [Terrisporobacter vanillatitrophus]|uniref:TetR/AcrR family transcriptional regulator n=1 Tax=Terrisporobacter vanillatitrophus TaxID=3058402 RepID=UPI003366C895